MLVQHKGFIGVYSHLGRIAAPILNGRRAITAGEELGTVGMTGLTYGPHLYFGMVMNDKPVDPARFLRVSACASKTLREARIPPSREFGGHRHFALAHTSLTHEAAAQAP